MTEFEIIMGLEVHVQLLTSTKMFCSCSTTFGSPPNSQVCSICLGLPGTLPVVNKKAVELALKVAHALNCQVAEVTKFDRKNYFYPDLPKGYQISQFDQPILHSGHIMIPTPKEDKKIRITRAHMEEDAGKMIHQEGTPYSFIDLNRVGTPLLEIVSAPDIESPDEAYSYLKELKAILEYLEISDCNMQEGSLRCDVNLSIRPKGQKTMGTRTEIKNLNSFNFVRLAASYEAERQKQVVLRGGKIEQGTYLWDENEQKTKLMRSKEDAHDYRYFPEPDLGSFLISKDLQEKIHSQLPELPRIRSKRMQEEYKISEKDCAFLIEQKVVADYFEACLKKFSEPQELLNWMKGQVRTYLNEHDLAMVDFPIPPKNFIELLELLQKKTINRNAAKEIFEQMAKTGKRAKEFSQQKQKITDENELRQICQEVIKAVPQIAEDCRTNPKAMNALVGQLMKRSKGRADVDIARRIFGELIGE